jgi:8-oxo-dGTP diphosphatase
MHPKVKAWGIIARGGQRAACFTPAALQFLVQCDPAESSCCLPGGDVAWGETAARSIKRHLAQEYDMEATVGVLAAVVERLDHEQTEAVQEVGLIHRCEVVDARDLPDVLPHRERPGVRLVWRNLAELERRPLHPEGILPLLQQEDAPLTHLVVDRL